MRPFSLPRCCGLYGHDRPAKVYSHFHLQSGHTAPPLPLCFHPCQTFSFPDRPSRNWGGYHAWTEGLEDDGGGTRWPFPLVSQWHHSPPDMCRWAHCCLCQLRSCQFHWRAAELYCYSRHHYCHCCQLLWSPRCWGSRAFAAFDFCSRECQ